MAGIHTPGRTLLALTLLATPSGAQQPDAGKVASGAKEPHSGAALFKTYCATCHGSSATGHGPLADHLHFQPPDLTLIARRNKGKWDGAKVARMIDGREPVQGHGGPEMPVWGDSFKNSWDGYDEESVKGRVRALVEYLESLQATAGNP